MRILGTILSYLVIFAGTFFLPWWAVILGMLIYLVKAPGLGLPFIMLLVDAYYGVLASGPWLTLGSVVAVLVMTFVRPLLRGEPRHF